MTLRVGLASETKLGTHLGGIFFRSPCGRPGDRQAGQRLQSSSASRVTAGALGFLTFTQCSARPER